MQIIAVSQRVDTDPRTGERRDGLDQAWARFLAACGCLAWPVPNTSKLVEPILDHALVAGVLLTGGNDLVVCGGSAVERDRTDYLLLNAARRRRLPVLGVCRGMQVIQHAFGAALGRVPGHVAAEQVIAIDGRREPVNSYHRFGTVGTVPDLEVWARADDGMVKAVRHRFEPITGIMWHPERLQPFADRDMALVRAVFGGGLLDSEWRRA